MVENYKEPQTAPNAKKKDAPRLIESWSAEEVGDWLQQIDLSQYKDTFVSNAIDGTELCNMTDRMLIDLGVGKYDLQAVPGFISMRITCLTKSLYFIL